MSSISVLGLIRKSHKNKVHPLCNLLFSNIKLSKLSSDNKRGIFANLCMIYVKFIVLVKNYDPYTSWSRKLIGRSWHERGIQDKNNNLIYMALHFWMEFFYERWLFELRHEKFEYNLNRYPLQISLPHWGRDLGLVRSWWDKKRSQLWKEFPHCAAPHGGIFLSWLGLMNGPFQNVLIAPDTIWVSQVGCKERCSACSEATHHAESDPGSTSGLARVAHLGIVPPNYIWISKEPPGKSVNSIRRLIAHKHTSEL